MDRGWMQSVRDLLRQRGGVLVVVLVTLLTLSLIGMVVMVTTPAGCSLVKSLTVKSAACVRTPVALVTPSAPTPSASPFVPPSNPPFDPGPSPNPPYTPPASAADPFAPPGSGAYPPLAYPPSGATGPAVIFSCRLPVYAGGPGFGGVIALPGGNFVADPRSAVAAPSPSPGPASPTPGPYR